MQTVDVYENGPLGLATGGSYVVTHADGTQETIERDTVALCRCGESSNKPFCDGTHAVAGFTAPGGSVQIG